MPSPKTQVQKAGAVLNEPEVPSGAGVALKEVWSLFLMPTCHTATQVFESLAALFFIQLPDNKPGKAVDDSPSTRATTTHVENPYGVAGS